jgi:hypothetical protein
LWLDEEGATMSEAMQKRLTAVEKDVTDLKSLSRRTMLYLAQMSGDLVEMKKNMATKDDISALNERMDGFSGLLLDSRQRWAVHADTLKRHDTRLTALETRAKPA